MTMTRKIGIILIIIGICLPTATLPFITEFRPAPELCLTSNFFKNMGNMVVAFGVQRIGVSGNDTGSTVIAVPYRYLFSLGIVLVCAGLVAVVITADDSSVRKN